MKHMAFIRYNTLNREGKEERIVLSICYIADTICFHFFCGNIFKLLSTLVPYIIVLPTIIFFLHFQVLPSPSTTMQTEEYFAIVSFLQLAGQLIHAYPLFFSELPTTKHSSNKANFHTKCKPFYEDCLYKHQCHKSPWVNSETVKALYEELGVKGK